MWIGLRTAPVAVQAPQDRSRGQRGGLRSPRSKSGGGAAVSRSTLGRIRSDSRGSGSSLRATRRKALSHLPAVGGSRGDDDGALPDGCVRPTATKPAGQRSGPPQSAEIPASHPHRRSRLTAVPICEYGHPKAIGMLRQRNESDADVARMPLKGSSRRPNEAIPASGAPYQFGALGAFQALPHDIAAAANPYQMRSDRRADRRRKSVLVISNHRRSRSRGRLSLRE